MNKKRLNLSANRTLNIILTVIMLAAALMSVWLFASPTLTKQEALKKQDAMITEIESKIIDLDTIIESPVTTIPETDDEKSDLSVESSLEPEKEPVLIGTELGILTIERLDMKLPVVEGITKELLNIAVGHVPQTAAIGDIGNAVIAGHRMYDYGSFFNRLGEVVHGDIIILTLINGEKLSFEVDEIIEIDPGDQIAFIQPDNESIITLYTCTPIREATHRLLVRAIKI